MSTDTTSSKLVTFDSNVIFVAKAVSRLLNVPTKQWCYKTNYCITDLSNQNIKFYYNTPISMTDDNLEDNLDLINLANSSIFINFIYIDEEQKNDTYYRIKDNFKKLLNPVVIITRNSNMNYGYYNIKNSLNYPDKLIHSFISKIIQHFIDSDGELLDPNDLKQTNRIIENNKFIEYNFHDSINQYIDSIKSRDDCYVCQL